jgi:flagellar hook-associated protein 3 FlgL
MRVTNEMMIGNALNRLHTRLGAYERAHSQLATGKRILAPSDDPSGMSRAFGLRAAQKGREQEARNASDAKAWLNTADSQLQAAGERLHRARDLMVRGASDADMGERNAIAQELQSIRDDLAGIANSQHRGRPLFGGQGESPVVTQDGGGWSFADNPGAGDAVTRRLGDAERVTINVTAREAFTFAGDDGDTDVFALLDGAIAALRDPSGDVGSHLAGVDAARASVNGALAKVGATTNQVESAQRRTTDTLLTLRGELAEVEDVEIATAIMDLQVQEVAYEASLAALARALPPSLVSFLR